MLCISRRPLLLQPAAGPPRQILDAQREVSPSFVICGHQLTTIRSQERTRMSQKADPTSRRAVCAQAAHSPGLQQRGLVLRPCHFQPPGALLPAVGFAARMCKCHDKHPIHSSMAPFLGQNREITGAGSSNCPRFARAWVVQCSHTDCINFDPIPTKRRLGHHLHII